MVSSLLSSLRLTLLGFLPAAIAACGGGSSTPEASDPPTPPPPGALEVGLDARPSNPTCLAPPKDSTGGEAGVALERVFENLTFTQPLAMLQAPGDDSRWYVLEKGGRVRAFANEPDIAQFDADVLSISVNDASEGGLLGMAFHPDFAASGHVFVSFTEHSPMVSVVARFTSADGGATLDPGSRHDIIEVRQDANNHNGGQIAFGPDGYLYLGLGDGGGAGDPRDRAQDPTNLLGAFLRLDVDGATPYTVPSDNPFAHNPACPADHSGTLGCPEIYAWGLRNPWRWSFDRATGTLWAADVGQNAREEINHIALGGNYGWNCREGTIAYPGAGPSCAAATHLIDPLHDYTHDIGQSVTGGYVYRGSRLPNLAGQYVFGDFVSGRIWRLIEDEGDYRREELFDTALSVASFGEANDGELYVVDLGGSLHQLVPAAESGNGSGGGSEGAAPVAQLLSDTGCVASDDPREPAPGLIPYAVAAPAWFDGATRDRWLALPDGTTVTVDAADRFVFPEGTVLIERFRLHERLIETRLLMHHLDGGWAGYSYEWNEEQSDATLVQRGKVVNINGQDWLHPSGNQCLACHTAVSGFSLALETTQLNNDLTYATTGRTANQLATLDAIGLFDTPLGSADALPALPNPADASTPLAERARAYLHVNCAHCHQPNAPSPGALDLRFTTLLDQTGACDAAPQGAHLDIPDPRIIAPGAAARSVLLERMRRRDVHGMPPLGSTMIDDEGVALTGQWIDALEGCL